MARIVVTGGTGFIGRAVSGALLGAGHEVRVLTRDPTSPRIPAGARPVDGDVADPASLRAAFAEAEAVVNAVQFKGHPVQQPAKGLTYDAVDRAGTERQVDAAREAGVGRFAYLSGAGAGQGRSEPWFRAKDAAEAAVRTSGMRWAIVRPSWIYGPEDRSLNVWVEISRSSPVVPLLSMGNERVQSVFVGDVALAVVRLLERPEAWDAVYEIGGPERLSFRQIVGQMLEVSGRRRIVLPVPKLAVKLGAAGLALLPDPILSPQAVDFATTEAPVDSTAVRERLGVEPRRFRDGIAGYLGAGGRG